MSKIINYLVEGQMSFEVDKSAPNLIMYMPAGKHTIYCRVNGEPKELEVQVTAKTAEKLQGDLEELLKQNVDPFIDFDHEGKASAAIPKRFVWKPEGVFMEVDWTDGGKAAVEGRNYRYFSPTFNVTPKGDPAGLPASGPIGALTNNPAFRDIKRIAASRANTKTEGETIMASHAKFLKAISDAVQFDPEDKDASWENDADNLGPRLVKHIKAMQKEMGDNKAKAEKADKDKEDMKAEKEKAESSLAEFQKKNAETIVEAAITAGKIPGKNDKVKSYYVESFLRDPKGTSEVLEAMAPRGVFTPRVVVTGEERRDATAAASHEGNGHKDPDREIVMAQRALIAQVKAQNPGMKGDHDAIFNLAKAQRPELFVD